ncbi:MAG: UvrD-helicase domain-containing protein [Chloroflexi bacterium]|nr:UvrD-helicase domain-containing protein [Chloroflexota bacterium]
MKPTTEQYAAIHNHDENLIVVAGAGSGKTRVLVERYIQLLESNPDWPISALVAITFTRAAAFEMKHRVRLELERRAKRTGQEHWARRLSQMDSARIDTIHGLCANILRANAAHAGVDPKFEVLDEIEAAIMLDEVVDDVLNDIKPPLTKLFAHYDAAKIVKALKQISLVNADFPPLPDDPAVMFSQWIEQWWVALSSERQDLIDSAEATALLAIDFLPAGDKLSDLVLQYQAYIRQISSAEAEAAQVFELMQACHSRGAVGNKGSAKAWGGQGAKSEVAQLLKDLRITVKSALDAVGEMPGDLARLSAQLLLQWHGLLEEVRLAYRERKSAAAQVDFDDLERLAADLLRHEDLRQRYRNAEFKHLLVDEFQDTNAAQWQIIRSLVDTETGGSLFAVGDPKQSIYQFRGADVSVFNRVREQFSRGTAGIELPLSISFRSHGKLVGQFNSLFESLLTRDGDSPVADYEVAFDKPMKAFRKGSPGIPAIELQLLDNKKRDEPGNQEVGKGRSRQRYTADEMRRWEAYEIAGRIKAIVEGQRLIFDKSEGKWRGIEFSDIAILFQSMSQVTIYEDAFKSQELPFLTIAGRGYYDRQEVWDMLELLRCLHNPADDLALATVLRSPIFAFSDDLLFALRLLPANQENATLPLPLWQALHSAAQNPPPGMLDADVPLVEHALETLTDLRRISGRVTISELLRRALEKTNYLAILTGLPDGPRRRGNIEKLLHLAEASGKITLGKFSRYLADLSTRELREGEAPLEAGNAIRLMTVHASKGLEFPLVILADASWERRSAGPPTLLVDPVNGMSCQVYDAENSKYVSSYAHRRNIELQALKEAAERKRLLYVAATRAQDYLLISGQVSQDKAGRWTSNGWLGQLLPALGLEAIEPERAQTRVFAGESISVLMPPAAPPPRSFHRSANSADGMWGFEASESEYPAYAPPLLEPVAQDDSPYPRHITASQLAEIGAYRAGIDSRERQSAADQFTHYSLPGLRNESIASPRHWRAVIGAIVHEILCYDALACEEAKSDTQIIAIAWEKGIRNRADLRPALSEVKELLDQYKSSDVYRWVVSARAESRPPYTELPFMFRTEKRVIHSKIDLVLQRPGGEWIIIDHKTSEVIGDDYGQHARRFLLQLGVYAAALRVKLDLDRLPRTVIHYIRGNRTVELASKDCMAELARLESTIGELVTNAD